MRQPFDNMAAGTNVDQPPWELAPNVWSRARNVRFRDGATETFSGQQQVFSSALGAPWRLLPISDGSNYYWVYCAPGNVYATDGTAHADISPTPNNLTTLTTSSNAPGWTGGAFQGFMVLANGTTNDPMSWVPGLGNDAVALANWPATLSCQVIRPYRNFLFALRCTESGSFNSRLIRWGQSADPGSLPGSWDYTDPTVDTGRVEFGQTQDQVVDLLPLRDIGVLYKENYTWSIQYRGGIDNPFIFRQVFAEVGMLSEWCAAQWQGRHVVLSTNDVVLHDLNQAQSIIDRQYRRWLFNQIDGDNYRQCFVVPNYKNREIWICFPEAGHDFANLALVWNYQEGSLQVRDLGADVPHINWGIVSEGTGAGTFDDDVGTFDAATGTFDEQQFNPSVTSILMSDQTNLLQGDEGGTFDGQTITAYWERSALPLDKDVLRYAYIKRVFPKIVGGLGESLSVEIGTRKTLEDSVSWSAPQTFTIGTDLYVNFIEMGRIIDIRFTYTGTQTLRLFGFDIEWDQAGLF